LEIGNLHQCKSLAFSHARLLSFLTKKILTTRQIFPTPN
jgi:hypothetical protein